MERSILLLQKWRVSPWAQTVPEGSGWRHRRPMIDVTITGPDGTVVYKKDGIHDTGQLSFTAYGPRVRPKP